MQVEAKRILKGPGPMELGLQEIVKHSVGAGDPNLSSPGEQYMFLTTVPSP